MDFKYELGDELRETFTGFSGVVMARTECYTGCKHYGLQSKTLTKEGTVQEWQWFDEQRLELVNKSQLVKGKTGGPEQNAPTIC